MVPAQVFTCSFPKITLNFSRSELLAHNNINQISEIEPLFGKRILIKNRKIKEQMKIILAQYLEIFQISSSGKIYNKNIMKLQEFEIPLGVLASILDTFKKLQLN